MASTASLAPSKESEPSVLHLPVSDPAASPTACVALAAPALLDPEDLFRPTNTQTLGALFTEHAAEVEKVRKIADFAVGACDPDTMGYFFKGNGGDNHSLDRTVAERLFNFEGAKKAVDAAFWGRALKLTDVEEHMTSEKRDEWHKSIREMNVPPFEPTTVVDTLSALIDSRPELLAERVDLIFRGLSSEHVTNRPQGFSIRMILPCVYGAFSPSSRDTGLIADLRAVVAKFMGLPAPLHHHSYALVDRARKTPDE